MGRFLLGLSVLVTLIACSAQKAAPNATVPFSRDNDGQPNACPSNASTNDTQSASQDIYKITTLITRLLTVAPLQGDQPRSDRYKQAMQRAAKLLNNTNTSWQTLGSFLRDAAAPTGAEVAVEVSKAVNSLVLGTAEIELAFMIAIEAAASANSGSLSEVSAARTALESDIAAFDQAEAADAGLNGWVLAVVALEALGGAMKQAVDVGQKVLTELAADGGDVSDIEASFQGFQAILEEAKAPAERTACATLIGTETK